MLHSISDIVSVSESYIFQKKHSTSIVNTDKCPELKIVMSNMYTGFGETMTNCSFNLLTGDISTTMNYQELMKKGYCCSEYNVYRRIYWSIMELLYKGESGE
ncbi:unnamed protein product [Schistosoma margrebowiei]|uniref:Uncharacterized protein n=1 Tax=Schistosoma margrebowiei TaxID=48269 RepID=A0AA85AGA9_9TREM|nr:unnamed protein product [Schistosoma margrebowiei]